MDGDDKISEYVRKSTQAQGLPEKVEDMGILCAVARMLRNDPLPAQRSRAASHPTGTVNAESGLSEIGEGVARYSAAICMRGHIRDSILEVHQRKGEQPEKFCSKCGAPVVTACPNCGSRLLGGYEGVVSPGPKKPDDFCTDCGEPYPWADRAAMIMQLRNILEYEPGLDDADRLELTEQIAVLSKPEEDEKKRIRAGERVKQLAPKGWATAQPIITSLISAELQRRLGIPPA